MASGIAQAVREIVRENGDAILHEYDRFEPLLRARAPNHPREVAILVMVVKAGGARSIPVTTRDGMSADAALLALASDINGSVDLSEREVLWALNTLETAVGDSDVTAGTAAREKLTDTKKKKNKVKPHNAEVTRVSLPYSPGSLAVGDLSAWITHPQVGLISSVDLNTMRVTATIAVDCADESHDGEPLFVAWSETCLWVACDHQVLLIDPKSRRTIGRVDLSSSGALIAEVSGIAATKSAGWLATDEGILRIDAATSNLSVVVPVGVDTSYPLATAVAASADSIWAAFYDDIAVRIDARSGAVTHTVRGVGDIDSVAISDDAVWVAGRGKVYRIDLETYSVTDSLVHGKLGHQVEVSADGDAVWVLSRDNGRLWSVDADRRALGERMTVPRLSGRGSTITSRGDAAWMADASDPDGNGFKVYRVRRTPT